MIGKSAFKIDESAIAKINGHGPYLQEPETEIGPEEVNNDINFGEFPVDAFPGRLPHIIKSLEKSSNFPVDFTGAAILYATSLAIGNSRAIRVKNNWYEKAVLYMAIIGNPGTSKTHPMNFAIKPIKKLDKRCYYEFKQAKKEYDAYNSATKQQKGIMDEKPKPERKQYLISDFTIEALVAVHEKNIYGIGVFCDELASWVKNFGRYKKGSGSDEETFISSWSGGTLSTSRKTTEENYISDPFVSVLGSMQPAILSTLVNDNRGENGFIDRMLFAFPDGLQKKPWSTIEQDENLESEYNDIITNIIAEHPQYNEYGDIKPDVYIYSQEASKRLYNWQKDNTELINRCPHDDLKGIYSKFDIYVNRIALILKCLSDSQGITDGATIEIDTVESSIQLIEYFRFAAKKVNSKITKRKKHSHLTTQQEAVFMDLPIQFTTGEGIEIAKKYDMTDRTFKTFLTNRDVFDKIKHGHYKKIITLAFSALSTPSAQIQNKK